MIFETQRLIVRQPTLADADVYYTLNSDPDIVQFIRPPRTRAEADAKLREIIAANRFAKNGLGGWLVDEKKSKKCIGFFGLFLMADNKELHIGYSLLKSYWGLGYATELSNAGITYAFKHLKLTRIVATTFAAHIASQKVLLKCGFVKIGTFIEDGQELFNYELLNQ